jgi:SAM-dependent methyltransferase
MKEFPEPKCTKTSYLHQSDILLCDSWNAIERNTGILQRLWYQQVGTWEIFRQTYYNSKGHRNEYGKTLCEFGNSLNNKRILEYGSGIAPFSSYMLKNCPKNINAISIVDVPAEHYYFALWSLRYKLDFFVGETASLRGYEIGEEKISFPENSFDIIIVITVFEHLPDPYAVAQTLLESLEEGGLVYEDFCADELHSWETSELISKDTSDPNLGVARIQRRGTIGLFDEKCSLLFGDYGTCSKRLWKCQ